MENDIKQKVRLYTAADFTEQRWKNGRGSTIELAKGSDYAPADKHSWRLSIATLTENGSYSNFCGFQRTQVMLEGDSVQLDFASAKQIQLHKMSQASFGGDEAVSCALASKRPATMFNLMTARDYLQHSVEIVSDCGPLADDSSAADLLFVYALQAGLTVQVAGHSQRLQAGQLLKINHSTESQVSLAATDSRLTETELAIVIKLYRVN
ncbi:hypothetical protein A9R01_00820 ['Osedax' symbiont bacterium Rs2_46_30_T18]|nr:hypothetical protein A9R01_00820 ['Osedax' symbiont bacterium Rs2_46_30_T18]